MDWPHRRWSVTLMAYSVFKGEEVMPPVKKVRGGWKVVSYVTGKTLKRTYKSKKAAQNAAATSKRRSKRVRHTRRSGY